MIDTVPYYADPFSVSHDQLTSYSIRSPPFSPVIQPKRTWVFPPPANSSSSKPSSTSSLSSTSLQPSVPSSSSSSLSSPSPSFPSLLPPLLALHPPSSSSPSSAP